MGDEKLFSINWVIENLISELLFGVLLLGIIGLSWRYVRNGWRVIRIFHIISTHNDETRTRRKGFHARDRFMDIYESKVPLASLEHPYNVGFIEGAFNENYLDKGILEYHGLVTIRESQRGISVEINKTRVTKWVYCLAKWAEEREKRQTEAFVLDKSGRQRKLPPQ